VRRLLVSLFVAAALWTGPAAAAEPRPNIIVILSDDMGFSDLGCYGGEIATPNLDALAANGLRFTQFYNTARCCPTRASLLTGLYPHQAGVGHMMQDHGERLLGYRGDLNRSCLTIAEVLRPAGYRNYAVGKWHVTRHIGKDGPKHNWPLARGFDRYYGTIHGAGSYYDPSSLVRDNTMISPFADPQYRPATYYYTDAIADHAVRFVGDHAHDHPGKPFFLYVAFTAAHWPMHALPADVAKYRGKYDRGYDAIRKARFEKAAKLGVIDPRQGLSPQAGDWAKVKDKKWEAACMEVYAAMVDRMDQGIGKIVAELRRTGQFDNTLLLFLQDNGACAEPMGRSGNKAHPNIERPARPTFSVMRPADFAAFGSVPHQTRDGYPVRMGPRAMPGGPDTYVAYGRAWANVSNTPFREYKHWVHEGGISTPLIAHWPRGIAAKGELRRQPGHLIDIAATCVDVARAKYPKAIGKHAITPLEGRSLVPAFAGRPIERDLFWEHEGNRAVRSGNWKLVARGPGGRWELYDVSADRTESNDLAARHPERVRDMSRKWEAWAARAHVLPWPWKPKDAPPDRAAPGRAAAPPREKDKSTRPTSHTAHKLEGWTVRVDDRLLRPPHAELGKKAIRFLENKLADIKVVVPADRLKKLQAVTIVLDLNCGGLVPMQYHPSAGWLRANGYSIELAKCVHIPRAADLPTKRNINEQPWVILHELAHAYHDQVLGFDEPRIRKAYENYKKSGRGERTLLYDGRRVRHYALTNHKEFFAEMTEAYFGVNDFFPFNRAELRESEPEIYALLRDVWESPAKR
jgi:arylsulfatase